MCGQPAPHACTADIPCYLGALTKKPASPSRVLCTWVADSHSKAEERPGQQVTLGSVLGLSQRASVRSSVFAGLWAFPGRAWQDVGCPRGCLVLSIRANAGRGGGDVGAWGLPWQAGCPWQRPWPCRARAGRARPALLLQQALVLN